MKFDDAKPAPIDQIKSGDQLRARGTSQSRTAAKLSAEEIVSGSFRNIAGTIKAIDAASNTMTVQDAIGKAAVVVKVSSDSQMKKLPPEMAQRIAMRLKGAAGGGERRATGRQAVRPPMGNGQGSAGAARAGSEAQGGSAAGRRRWKRSSGFAAHAEPFAQ